MGNRLKGATTQQVIDPVEGVIVPQQINSGVLFDPTADGWDIVQRIFDCNIWRNMKTGQQVQEYRLVANDEFQFMDYEKSFKLRFRNTTLVSSLFFKDETQSEFCTKYYKGNLYLERTPLRLSDIDQIPYPDVLHIYSQCFKGYAELFEAMGFFDISEQMICINAEGVVKVWLNKNLDKYLPPVCYHNGNERQMVLKVVRIISQNTNQNTLPDRISDWIIRADPYTFRDAYASLQGFASKYNTNIPGELNCVINFMRLKYIQEQQVYEGSPMGFDLNPEEPQVDIAGLNQMISQNFTPLFNQSPAPQYPSPPHAKIPPVTTTIVSQQLYHQPQVHRKRRRILQHKDYPVLHSNFIRDSTSGRIPMSSVVTNPISNSYAQNRITFGHQPVVQSSNVYSSQNPFKSVLQKLKISNHYQPKTATAPFSQTVYVPQRDIVSNTYQSQNNYSSNAFSKQKTNNSYYESGMVTSGGGVVTNSLAAPKYPTYGNYGVSDSIQQGKTSPQILAFIRKFKNSNRDISPIQFQTSSSITKNQSRYKYQPSPPPIVSQTSSGAVYKDIGNTSHLVDHNKFTDSFSVVQNRLQIIEQTVISTVRRQQSSRPRFELSNIDQEIQKDLRKFRSSKASKASRTSYD